MSVQSVYALARLDASCSRIGVKAEPLERVVEQGLADGDLGFPVLHSVVESDDFLLHVRQFRVRANFQRHFLVPVSIFPAPWRERVSLFYKQYQSFERS